MIQNADKGSSGFWVEDHEGCGNPKIFPEFMEGLKRGSLVQSEKRVFFYLDSQFVGHKIGVHPNDNTATVWLDTNDLVKLIKEHGTPMEFVELA